MLKAQPGTLQAGCDGQPSVYHIARDAYSCSEPQGDGLQPARLGIPAGTPCCRRRVVFSPVLEDTASPQRRQVPRAGRKLQAGTVTKPSAE